VILGRPVADIEAKSAEICLAKDKGFRRRSGSKKATRMPRWTMEEGDLLKELYPELSNLEIARRLNRSQKSVVSKAHDLGLKKTSKRLRDMGRENVSLRYQKPDGEEEGQDSER